MKKNMVEKKCIVGLNGIGDRLDRYLAKRFTYNSRTEWQGIIESGKVRVNRQRVRKASARLKASDEILYQMFDFIEPDVDKHVTFLYDDGDLMICNKPGNLPVIPAGKYHENTFYSILKNKLGASPKLINRIDRETSGCVIAARTEEMARGMKDVIGAWQMRKLYLAIVKGDVREHSFTVMWNIGYVHHEWYRNMQGPVIDGRFSKTDFFRVAENNGYALLLCRIHTGRMHQIRAHLKDKGYHVVGDKVYGPEGPDAFQAFVSEGMNDALRERLEIERQALHAYKLSFKHPLTGTRVIVKAPLPPDMRALAKEKGILPPALARDEEC